MMVRLKLPAKVFLLLHFSKVCYHCWDTSWFWNIFLQVYTVAANSFLRFQPRPQGPSHAEGPGDEVAEFPTFIDFLFVCLFAYLLYWFTERNLSRCSEVQETNIWELLIFFISQNKRSNESLPVVDSFQANRFLMPNNHLTTRSL